MGVVQYSHRVKISIGLGEIMDKNALKTAIANLPYSRGLTFTDIGLKELKDSVLSKDMTRPGVKRYYVLLSYLS